MNEFKLGSSVALALEIMIALIHGRLREWYDKRYAFCSRPDFAISWGSSEGRVPKIYELRLSEFSATLRRMRITKIVPQDLVSFDVLSKIYEGDTDPVQVRGVAFHLGNDEDPSQVIVEIFLEEQGEIESEFASGGGLWNNWDLSQSCAIRCVKHPDSKLVKRVLLGMEVLD